MDRKTFLKQAFGLGSLVVLSPLALANTTNRFPQNDLDDPLFMRAIKANNKAVEGLIDILSKDIKVLKRDLGFDFANLVSAYSAPESRFYQHDELVPLMEKIMQFLLKEQKPDGTLDIANVESPN